MKRLTIVFLFFVLCRDVLAGVVGYSKTDVKPYTDVFLSIPLSRDLQGTYNVASKQTNGITVSGNPFTSGALSNKYYIRIINSLGQGLWSTITANTTNTLTLQDTDILNYLNVGDSFRIYKHNTIESILPDTMVNTSFNSGTTVYLSGNRSATYISNNWIGTGVDNNTPIEPESQFILRNNSDKNLQLLMVGDVPDWTTKKTVGLNKDFQIGTGYPKNLTLNSSGLGKEQRIIFLYNNSATGFNKTPYKTAYYLSGRWTGNGITGNEILESANSFMLRIPNGDGPTFTINKTYVYPDTGKTIKIENSTRAGSIPWLKIIYDDTLTLEFSVDLITWKSFVNNPPSPYYTWAYGPVGFYRAR